MLADRFPHDREFAFPTMMGFDDLVDEDVVRQ
jgi:hypothetical protein